MVLVQVALVVALVDAGRTGGVRVVPAGCPVAAAPGVAGIWWSRRSSRPYVAFGPARSMLAGTWAGVVSRCVSGRSGAGPVMQGNAERWPEPATG